jgi:hypothetical protein
MSSDLKGEITRGEYSLLSYFSKSFQSVHS